MDSNSANQTTKLTHLTDSNFDDSIKEGLVLVDFWAEWCTPCKMIAPVLEQLAQEWEGKVKLAKLNVDENPNVASRLEYGIQGIPAMLLFQDGKLIDRIVGAFPKAVYIQFLQKHYEAYESEKGERKFDDNALELKPENGIVEDEKQAPFAE